MAQAPSSSTPTVELHATSKPDPAPPDWLPQATLVAHWFVATGFLPRLRTALRLVRGRAGDFIGLDFAFALLLYAISAAPSLKAFYSAASSVSSLLAGLWQRDKLPSRSALSRGLDDLTHEVVAAVEALFFEALLLHGCKGPLLGGIRDRAGPLTLCFDLDGTRKAVRQRALAQGPQWPEPRRRFREVCKPGYTGRQRGEVVRTRSVLMQAHTQEWMGTWGAPGNGQPAEDLQLACLRTLRYLAHHGLEPAQGLMRLDGLYGTLPFISRIAQHGLGWLARCTHYALLQQPEVRAVIAHGPVGRLEHPETQMQREVFDRPDFEWTNKAGDRVITRLVITRYRCEKTGKPRVGVRQGKFVYELFVTDRSTSGFTAQDVVELYNGRGGFEQRLSEEDQEQATDRFVSQHPPGQQLWQVLQQWVWNIRLWLGRPEGAEVRVWLFSPAQPPPPAEEAPGVVAEAQGRGSGRFGGADFRWASGKLMCPASQELSLMARCREGHRVRRVYGGRESVCSECPLRSSCLGRQHRSGSGRTVSVWETPSRVVWPGAGELRWLDVAGRSWRKSLQHPLGLHRVEIVPLTSQEAEEPKPLPARSRSERVHRRRTWLSREAQNAAPRPRWRLVLHGIPEPLCQWLCQTQPLAGST